MSDSSTFNNFHYGFIWRNLLSLDEKWIVSGAEGFLEVYKKFKKSSTYLQGLKLKSCHCQISLGYIPGNSSYL